MPDRRFVGFESLWNMPIDIPYSLLVRDGEEAWSCGQLALDADSNVLEADDLVAQSSIVASYISEILQRGDLDVTSLKRLLLFYVPDDRGDDAQRVDEMRAAFRAVVGDDVLLDTVPVPHFYYDGIVLEVDAFAGPASGGRFGWESVEVPLASVDRALDSIDASSILSAHWSAPATETATVGAELERRGLVHDRGAVVSTGSKTDLVRGSIVRTTHDQISSTTTERGGVPLTARRAGSTGWIAARSTDPELGLVEQTERIMEAIAYQFATEGLDFDAVVKSTTLYSGGNSAAELHDNMRVRNRRYQQPGPASTGLPVYGFADPNSLITVDVTYTT